MNRLLLVFACIGVGYVVGEGVIVCYWQSWSTGRPSPGDFKIQDFDGNLCTHLIFAFAGVRDSDGAVIDLMDPSNYWTLLNWRDVHYPHLKVLLAVGGWNEGAAKFSEVANEPNKRINFAQSAATFCKIYGFDGIDMDWEYPGEDRYDSPGKDYDKANFPLLLKAHGSEFPVNMFVPSSVIRATCNDIKSALDKASGEMGKDYLLTAAVGCGANKVNQSYAVDQMDKVLDYWHLMSYDLRMFGLWQDYARRLGHHAPLRQSGSEGYEVDGLNLEEIIQNFVDEGATRKKLVLGVGTYGKTYTLNKRSEHKIWDYAAGPGVAEPFLATEGTISYAGICHQIPMSRSNFEIHYDEDAEVPFAFNDTLWIGYDNPESIEKKVDLAYEEQLGGMMIWSIDMDDCKNLCEDWFSCPLATAVKDRMDYYQNVKGGWPRPD